MKEDTMKTKHEMREAAIKRLRETMNYLGYYRELIWAIIGDDFDELTSRECAERIIDLLTDEPQYEGDAYAMGPRDANGIIWIRGDMSDSEWGVIEQTYFDGEQWLVCGHDISAPWIPADSIRHVPMRTATQREDVCRCRNCIATKRNNDLIELLKDAARDYESLQADCRGMSDLKDTCWQKFKDLHEAVDERYIELPVDANGEPWHIGDVTENGNVVKGMAIDNTGEWYFINTRNVIDPQAHYHYKKPTVEDMLRDFAYCLEDGATEQSMDELVGEYAKKLQLKEMDE
jgi:hypothetical protein